MNRAIIAGICLGLYWVSVMAELVAGCIAATHYWFGGVIVGIWVLAAFFIGVRLHEGLQSWIQRGRGRLRDGSMVHASGPLDRPFRAGEQHNGSGSEDYLTLDSLPIRPRPIAPLIDDPLADAILETMQCDPREDGWSGANYLSRHDPVRESRPCQKHSRPDPDCSECRFKDER